MIKTSKRRAEELKRRKELEAKEKRQKAVKTAVKTAGTVGAIGAGVVGVAAFLKTEKGQETLEAVYDKASDAVTIVKEYAELAADKAKELVKSPKDEDLFYVDDEDEIVISKEFDEEGNEIIKEAMEDTMEDAMDIAEDISEEVDEEIEETEETKEEPLAKDEEEK